MSQHLHAVLIEPQTRTVRDFDYHGGGDPRAMCAIIGAKTLDTASVFAAHDVLAIAYVDDVGLIQGKPCFRFTGYAHPLAGKTLVLGCDRSGCTVDCPLSAEQFRPRVHWVQSAHALAQERAARAIDAAYYRSMGCEVETEQSGLVNLIAPPPGPR